MNKNAIGCLLSVRCWAAYFRWLILGDEFNPAERVRWRGRAFANRVGAANLLAKIGGR